MSSQGSTVPQPLKGPVRSPATGSPQPGPLDISAVLPGADLWGCAETIPPNFQGPDILAATTPHAEYHLGACRCEWAKASSRR